MMVAIMTMMVIAVGGWSGSWAATGNEPHGAVRVQRDRNSEGGFHFQTLKQQKDISYQELTGGGKRKLFDAGGLLPHWVSPGDFFLREIFEEIKRHRNTVITGILEILKK
jgi:hypothetical protein